MFAHLWNSSDFIPLIAIPDSTLKQEMRQYINNKDFSDVTLVVEDKTIFAHKAILSRSKTFDSMFQKQKDLSEVKITEVKHSIFTCILEYLYTDDINLEVKNAEDALVVELKEASEKYGIRS